MTQVKDPKKKGEPYRFALKPGHAQKLPGGKGTIKLTGVKRWVKLQVSDTPGVVISLSAIGGAVLGLSLSLFIRPRRIWARVRTTQGRRMLEIAGLDKADARTGLDTDLDKLAADLDLGTSDTGLSQASEDNESMMSKDESNTPNDATEDPPQQESRR